LTDTPIRRRPDTRTESAYIIIAAAQLSRLGQQGIFYSQHQYFESIAAGLAPSAIILPHQLWISTN
jgi:hypothetical protein